MKKIWSFVLALLLAAAVLPSEALCAESADGESESIVLNADNFTLSGQYSVIDTSGLADKVFTNSVKVQRLDAIGAKFYIEKAGDYSLWFLTGASSSDEGRAPKATIDSETFTLAFSNELTWKQADNGAAKTWSFNAGWHTVSLTTTEEWKPFFFNALYITNDPSAVPATDSDDALKAYSDNTVPVIADADISASFSGGECSVVFPSASDENTVIYEYTIGENTTEIPDITQPVCIGKISGETAVTLTASDKFGNSAQKQFVIEAPQPDPVPENEHILLSGDNFTVPDYTNGGYIQNGGTATGNLFRKSAKIAGGDASKYITARIYIKQAGTYNLWLLSANELDSDNANFSNRVAKAGFDGELRDCTPHKTHVWESSTWELGAGWHTLDVGMKNAWGNVLVNAAYITGDLTEAVNTDNDDSLLAYHDTDAPVFASAADVATSFENGVFKVKFPEATDSSDIIYEYKVGETRTAIENIKSFTAVNGISGTGEIILAAYDKWGNKAEKTFTITVPATKWMLTWNNFVKPDFGDAKNWGYSASHSLGSKSIFPNTVSDHRTESASAKAKAMIYVEEAGSYAVWVLSRNDKANDGRTAKIYIDGIADQTEYNDSVSFAWSKGTGPENGSGSWNLSKGWHTVEFGLKTEWKPYYLDAIYITSDPAEMVTADNDNALLALYGSCSVNVNGALYTAGGLAAAGFVTDDAAVNIAPVLANNTDELTAVTVNGSAAAWNEPMQVSLSKGINTVSVASSDNTVSCRFKVVSTGTVINHADSAASVSGGIESAYIGADGVSKAITLTGDASAKFSAQGISGNTEIWVYVIGAGTSGASAKVNAVSADGASSYTFSNASEVSAWVKLGEVKFSGSDGEFVEIKADTDAAVYVDCVKFRNADEYIFSAPQTVNENGKIKFIYEFYKQSDDLKTPSVVIAEYLNNRLNGISISSVSISNAGIYTVATNEFNISDGAVYKGFIWNSVTDITPLAQAAQ